MQATDFKDPLQERPSRLHQRDAGGGRKVIGLFLLGFGILLFIQRSGHFLPDWFFSWPVFLMCIGLGVGINTRFRGFGWLFPVLIGGLFLIDKVNPQINLRPYMGPALLVGAGLFFLLRRNRQQHYYPAGLPAVEGDAATMTERDPNRPLADYQEVIDITAVFGGVKKNVLTKTLRGGEIVAVMGGAEVNLLQSDFEGKIRLECTNVMGGTKLIIPADWDVHSEIVSIFGGIDDKRPPVAAPAPGKILFLEGTCFMGGVEIRSF